MLIGLREKITYPHHDSAANSVAIRYVDLVKLISQTLKRPIKINHQAARPGDVMHSLGNPEKIISLGLKPKISLPDGLHNLIKQSGKLS